MPRKIIKKSLVEKQPEPESTSIALHQKSQRNYTPLLIVALLIVTFLLGMATMRIQQLDKSAIATQPTQPQNNPSQNNQQPAIGQKYNVSNGHFPLKGQDNAKVTVIEFADIRCPYCKQFFNDVEPQLMKDYVDTGKVKFAFRHFAFLGPASVVGANALECANEQGKFWDLHDYLYQNQPSESDTSMYNTDSLTTIAGNLGMNTDQFRSCLSTNKYQKNVDQDYADGQKAGVSGTPTFFIDGTQLVGAQPYDSFKTLIDQELKK